MAVNENKIMIVGTGPGGGDYVTDEAKAAVLDAEVIVGAQRLLDLFKNSNAERVVVDSRIDPLLETIESKLKTKKVAVLVSGSPRVFSLAKRVIERFGEENCEVIEGVSSVQVAFERLGLDWMGAKVVSAHHVLEDIDGLDLEGVERLGALTGHKEILGWLKKVNEKMGGGCKVYKCENLTLEDEVVCDVDLETATDDDFQKKAIIVFVKG